MRRSVLALALASSLGSSVASVASAQSASYGQYLLVLDDSGSMDQNDPRRLVTMAAYAFVGALEDGDQVMLAGLNELATGAVAGPAFRSPRELLDGRDGAEGTRPIGAPNLERHQGATPCREALERARSILESMATAGAPQTLLLLTDGACNQGALPSASEWLGGLRAHREGRFRFVLLMQEGRERADPILIEMARATGWTGETRVAFDARALLRAFAEVLSFSRGLRYDDGGRVGLERTFAGARVVRVLAIQEQGVERIALERVEHGQGSALPGGPTYRHPQYRWSLRTAADGPSATPYAVRSSTAGAEVLVIPVYGRLRVEAIVAPCGEAPAPPWSHERSVRAGQPACAWARLVGDAGETIHPTRSFELAIEVCSNEACFDASAMQAGPDGTFHAQLGAEMPLGRHERTFRASGAAMAVPVRAARAFSAVAFGVHRVALASEPARPIQEVELGTLPEESTRQVALTVSGAFPADARAAIECAAEGDAAACVRCAPTPAEIELTDPFQVQLDVSGTAFCPAVSADARPLPVQLRATIRASAEVPERSIPIRATLRYAPVERVRLSVRRGEEASAELTVPGPLAPTLVRARVELDADELEVAPVEAEARARADAEARTITVRVRASAEDCCGAREYEGALVLSAPDGSELRVPLAVTVEDAGFWVCPGRLIAKWTALVLAILFLIWLVRGFLSPASFRKGAILVWADSHEALLRVRQGDEGWYELAAFAQTRRRFRKDATLSLGGSNAPLPSLQGQADDARIVAKPGGGAALVVDGPGTEKFEESGGWVEIKAGEHLVASRITLRRGDDYLQFRP
ncbi:MAG: VWA domain-containing protein [Sandaracinaceae bacterium]|nr:VWA domain-containing protein [Sandaracinaceae bacterium]